MSVTKYFSKERIERLRKQREKIENTDWSNPKYNEMYESANENAKDLMPYVYSIIVTQPD